MRTVDNHDFRTHGLLQAISRRLEDFVTGHFTFQWQPQPPTSRPDRSEPALSASTVLGAQPLRTGVASKSSDLPPPVSPSLDPDTVFPYTMCRTLTSVHDLWQEWNIGLRGSPSIQALESTYGAKWRQSSQERMFFGRRKVIIDEVFRRLRSQGPIEAVIEEVELIRKRELLSLHSLSRWLKQQAIVRSQGKRIGKK